jgi:predicted SprT family Zn-dependent metalloprotease
MSATVHAPATDGRDAAARLQAEGRARAQGLGLPALAARLQMRWHRRLRTTAGMARVREALVLLNPRLLAFPEELRRTFLHELAHLVVHERFPKRRTSPHGAEWRQACRDLGLPGEPRCHDLPLAPRRTVRRNHVYHCPHCRTEVARVRPFRHREACLHCCRRHAAGRYDGRFRFECGPAPVRPAATVQPELFRLW